MTVIQIEQRRTKNLVIDELMVLTGWSRERVSKALGLMEQEKTVSFTPEGF
ncbi:hypothetical protein [Streptococcus sp. E17BB]|uniref:hypothetical protein n=1 Tax=Streptococcus sp. E17BB TaxID=3278714 RepID=UPI00359E1215